MRRQSSQVGLKILSEAILNIIYLAAYVVNGWFEQGITPILVSSGIFVVGYIVIWAVIYTVTQRSTAAVNEKLRGKYSEENK